MYRRYLGISAVALAGLLALGDNATAQNRPKGSGSGERREGASNPGAQESGKGGQTTEPRREGEQRREGEIRQGGSEIRREGETRSGGNYYGPSNGRGIYGPGYSFFGGPRYYYRYGYPGYYGNGYYYGYGDPGYYDNGYYDDGWNGGRRGRFFGRSSGWSGYSYGAYSYGSGGCHGGCHGGYGSACHGGYYGSGCNGSSGYYGMPANGNRYAYGAMDPNAALIDVKLGTADAQLFFDDAATQQTGAMRQFVTPALEPKKEFSYMVHAKWKEGDRDMDDSRTVKVHAGDRLTVDFTTKQEAIQGNGAKPEAAPRPGLGDGAAIPPPDAAQQIPGPDQGNLEVHEGQFLSFREGTLEMTDIQGKKLSHHLAPGAQIMIDGKDAKPEDLKADMKLKVSTKKGDPQTVTKIEVKSQGKQQNGEKRAPDLGAPPAPKQPDSGAAPAPKQPGEKPAPDKGAPPPPEQPKP